MSKAEIIAELAHLSPQDLAEVRDWLDRLAQQNASPPSGKASAPRIRSPRLANSAQSRDFIKQVRELPPHAAV